MTDLHTPEITQALLALSSLIITSFVGWVARKINERTGYEIDARAQATLHSALTTGAHIAWSRFDGNVTGPKPLDMINIVVSHVLGEGAKDAVSHFNLSPATIQNLAEAKLTEVGARLAQGMTQPKVGDRT